MTTRTRTDPRKKFAPRFLPWLLAAASFALYWFTLNRWVSISPLGALSFDPPAFTTSLLFTAKLSGWTWQPELMNPVTYLVTYPFRWLSMPQISLALNVFSAVCAALTLGLLARSVALLPHDRTDAQRKRERSDFSFLTTGSAWLPPVLAVVVCGLQMTFWQNATNFTGEIFDLLLFAFVIWSLLEYRLDEREWRLFLAALVFGAGMANNWAMVFFFPAFIIAIVWIRGLSFFNLRFLQKLMISGLLGILLIFLLPVLAATSSKAPLTFWEALKIGVEPQYSVLKLFFSATLHPGQYSQFLALLLAYLMPILVMAIRWKSAFGDQSQIGMVLTNFLFHLVCAAFLFLCVWMAFDPPFSPRQLGYGTPCLTLYYLGALSIGYFYGYFLLIFGKEPRGRSSAPELPAAQFLNPLVLVSVWVFAVAATSGLIYRNTPQIRAANDDTFQKFASFMEESLPRSGGILLSDDLSPLFFVEAALARDGRAKDFVPLDTHSLSSPAYFRFLHNKYPQKWPAWVSAKQSSPISPIGQIYILTMLAQTNELYYLHPSFGYYFEQFYQEPHGLAYKLKILPNNTLLPPVPDKSQIAENQAFWSRVETQALAPIKRAVTSPDTDSFRSWGRQILGKLHVPREQDQNAVLAGIFYSRDLDFWGVQLQRAGDLTNAAACFALAKEVNPDNFVAQVNLGFNKSLRAGTNVPVDLSQTASDPFGKYRDWNQLLDADGPFDEPRFCMIEGVTLASQNKYFRQAIAPFERVRKFEPNNLTALLWLGQIYVVSHLPDRALDVLHDPLEHPERFSLAETNEANLNILAAAAYFQKDDVVQGTQLLNTEIARHPTNDNILLTAAQIYVARGLFTNALNVIDHKLRFTPNDPVWLFKRGVVSFQLNAYDDAIDTFTRVLAIQTTNSMARFYRAVAYLNSGKHDDAALADYKTLQQSFTNSFQVAYGLGEIAWRQHDTNEAIRNYKLYLANANTNSAEATNIIQRLRELEGRSP